LFDGFDQKIGGNTKVNKIYEAKLPMHLRCEKLKKTNAEKLKRNPRGNRVKQGFLEKESVLMNFSGMCEKWAGKIANFSGKSEMWGI
jgi:hypothetical protein